jgi:hypothetical protein
LNGTYQLLVFADGVNLLGHIINTIKNNTEANIGTSKEGGLELNTDVDVSSPECRTKS